MIRKILAAVLAVALVTPAFAQDSRPAKGERVVAAKKIGVTTFAFIRLNAAQQKLAKAQKDKGFAKIPLSAAQLKQLNKVLAKHGATEAFTKVVITVRPKQLRHMKGAKDHYAVRSVDRLVKKLSEGTELEESEEDAEAAEGESSDVPEEVEAAEGD